MQIWNKRACRIILLSGILLLLVFGTIFAKINSYERYHLSKEKVSFAEKIGEKDEYTLYYHFFKKAKPKVMKKITRTANIIKEYEGFQITLKEYIYDGNLAYACFTVKNQENTLEGLNLFEDESVRGNFMPSLFLEKDSGQYRITNDCGWGNINSRDGQYLDNTIHNNEKYLFYYEDNEDREEWRLAVKESGETEISDRTKNELYLVDKNLLYETEGINPQIDNAKQLTFSMDITTEKREINLNGDKIIFTPLQMKYKGYYMNSIKNVILCYKNGKRESIVQDTDSVNGITYIRNLRGEGDMVTKTFRCINPLDFDRIERVEIENIKGEKWNMEF